MLAVYERKNLQNFVGILENILENLTFIIPYLCRKNKSFSCFFGNKNLWEKQGKSFVFKGLSSASPKAAHLLRCTFGPCFDSPGKAANHQGGYPA